ncbi:MAG: DegT/DnrJ/EryC1/StrS family aminotransferase [Bacteroidota bacterium]
MKETSMHTDSSTHALTLDHYLKQFKGRSYFYGNASHAFYEVLVWLQKNRPKRTPNIVMPVYIPAKLYRFVLAAGYEAKFYDVPTDLNIDSKVINELIDDQTQAVFAAHFFGVPVDLEPVKKMTERAGVFLIEDCAHSMNASYNGRPLGSTGDCTLLSTRKMMQLHCGGILILQSEPWTFKPSRSRRVSSPFAAYHFAGSRIKYSVNHLLKSYSPFPLTENPYDGYLDLSEEHHVRVKKMDLFTKWYTHFSDLNKLAQNRRKRILHLLNGIRHLDSFRPIGMNRFARRDKSGQYSLIDGFVPFSLPILTPIGSRDRIQRALSEAGVLCYTGWPEAPFGLKGFKGADILKDRLLELPVHSFMDAHHLQLIVDCLNSLPLSTGDSHDPSILNEPEKSVG